MNAIEKTLDALAQTSADALYERALAMRHGDGVRVNYAAAHRFFLLSALMGRPAARYQLAQMNLRGEGRAKDRLRAAMWLLLAMGRHEAHAARSLQQLEAELTRAEQREVTRQADDFERAVAAFQRALAGADPEAMVALGEQLAQGRGVDRDPEMASEWYRRALAFRHPPAQTRLGLAYLNGEGVERHQGEGQRLLRLAAAQGYPEAQYQLAQSLLEQTAGRSEAFKLLGQAAASGHAAAQVRLGELYKLGEMPLTGTDAQRSASSRRETDPHLVLAREWFEKAAAQGLVDARFELGLMHAQGLGTRQDFERAAECYLAAANDGHAKAQFNLGFLYAHGQGVEQDYGKAYQWYRISERSGYALAQQNAGLLLKKLGNEEREMAEWRIDSFFSGG